MKTLSLAALVLFTTLRAAAAPAPKPAAAAFGTDARVEALSVVLLLASPDEFAVRRAGIKDEYAEQARAAFAKHATHPAVVHAADFLKRGVSARALARFVLDGSADSALRNEAAAFLVELNDFKAKSGFAAFYDAHRSAYRAFADGARAESLRAMSPDALAKYFGRPLKSDVQFVLAPLFPEDGDDSLAWRSGTSEYRLRPRSRTDDGTLGFQFDVPEKSVAAARAEATASGWLRPASPEIAAHLARAAGLRVLALELGEAAYRDALLRPALTRHARLAAVAEGLKEYEASRARYPALESFITRLAPLAALRLDEAALAAKAGERARALAHLSAALAQNPDLETRRGVLRLYQDLKEYAPARALLDALIASEPADAGLRVESGSLAARMNRRADALEALAKASTLSPSTEANRAAARLSLDLGAYELARAPLDALIAADPRDARVRLERASVAARTGERAAALEHLASARALKPDADARRRIASLYQDLKEFKSAQSVLDDLVKASPQDGALRLARAELASQAGDRDAAAKYLEEARKLTADTDARRRMAEQYLQLRDFVSARNLSDELMRNAPADAGLRLDRAALAATEGDRAAALAFLAQARRLGPDAAGLRRMAALYAELKDFPAAMALLDERIKAAPSDAALRLDRAQLAARTGDEKNALSSLAAASAASTDAISRRRMARLYQDLKHFSEAAALLDGLVREFPRDAELRVDRAALAAAAGDAAAAKELLAQAEALSPERAERRRMALVRQNLKDYDGAAAALEALAKEKPEPSVYADIGVCRMLAGRSDDAVAALNKAIKLDPRAMPPYFTLGAIYAQRKEFVKELAVYDSAPMPENDPSLRDLLVKSRQEASMRAKPNVLTIDTTPGPPGPQPPGGAK